LFLDGQPRPHPKGRHPSAPQFLGFLSIYVYSLCHRTIEFDVGEESMSWGKPRLPFQESRVLALPNVASFRRPSRAASQPVQRRLGSRARQAARLCVCVGQADQSVSRRVEERRAIDSSYGVFCRIAGV